MYLVQGKLQLQEGEAEPFPGEKKTDQKGGEFLLLSRTCPRHETFTHIKHQGGRAES